MKIQNYFEFIHIRNISQGIEDWDQLLGEAYRCTKPSGYLELAELEMKLYSDDNTMAPAFNKWIQLLKDASDKMKRPSVSGVNQTASRKRRFCGCQRRYGEATIWTLG